jgi:rubrerythrin
MNGEPTTKRKIPVTIVIEDGVFQDILCDEEDIEFEVTVEDHDVGEGEEGEEPDDEFEETAICSSCGNEFLAKHSDEDGVCPSCRKERQEERDGD